MLVMADKTGQSSSAHAPTGRKEQTKQENKQTKTKCDIAVAKSRQRIGG